MNCMFASNLCSNVFKGENGKVKKKQTVICTIGYYEVVDWGDWPGDYIIGGLLLNYLHYIPRSYYGNSHNNYGSAPGSCAHIPFLP